MSGSYGEEPVEEPGGLERVWISAYHLGAEPQFQWGSGEEFSDEPLPDGSPDESPEESGEYPQESPESESEFEETGFEEPVKPPEPEVRLPVELVRQEPSQTTTEESKSSCRCIPNLL